MIVKLPRAGLRRRKQLGVALAAFTASESSPSEGEMKSSLLLFPLALLLFNPTLIFLAGTYDPELRLVFELATDSELYELENILFGPR